MLSWTAFFYTIILLGTVQGFIVSGLLFSSASKTPSNRILAVLILLITLACFNLYGNYQNWFNLPVLRFIADLVPLVMVMPLGPLIYFYIQSCLHPGFTITKKQRPHFYPVLIDLVPSLTVIIYIIGILTKLIKNNPGPWGTFIDDYNVYADIPRWMSVTFYVGLSARYLTTFQRENNGAMNGHRIHYKWLRQFIGAFMIFQVIWLVYLIPYVIPRYTNMMLDTFDWYPLYIPMTILIYWLGMKGYLISHPQIITDKKNSGNNTTLSPELIRQVILSITNAMDEKKVYRNPGFNLTVMAEVTGYPPKIISTVLNQHLHKSFNEFVNGYRVKEVKEKILQPEWNNLTIAGIALECGFNSQATFQRTFKEITGKSPSEFRKSATAPE